jgi:uncharacterized protein DUF4157
MRIRTRQEALAKKPHTSVPDSTLAALPESKDADSPPPGSAAAAGTGHRFETLSVDGARPQLTVSQPTDAAEHEAARVADRVAERAQATPSTSAERAVERVANGGDSVSSGVETLATQALAGSGEPLSSAVRREMEPALGHDFSQVRVHTGGAASSSARAINASAYTVGSDVVFGAGRFAPGTRDGNRLLAHELTHVVQNGGNASANSAMVLSRDVEVPPAPLTFNAPAEKEKDAFAEADKQRARTTVVAPLRAAAAQLGKGEKSDVPSVIRHLRPLRAAAAGVKWPEGVGDEVNGIMDGISLDRTLLESLKMSDRQAIAAAHKNWADARRLLAEVRRAIAAAEPDPKKNPDAQPREGSNRDTNAVLALSAQIEATMTDLIKAPRTQEGFKSVFDTAGGLAAMFDTIKPEEDPNGVEGAKDSFMRGVANIMPLALGKEESLKQVQSDLNAAANQIAAFVGDEAPAADTGEPGKDDDEKPPPQNSGTNPTPAPSPNPLPPPPPPPLPGTK